MNEPIKDAAALRQAFERDSQAILRCSWRFTWWRHGGEPGPDWMSDKIDLSASAGAVSGQYTCARNAPVPPFRSSAVEYRGNVPLDLASGLLRKLFERKLFEDVFPSEGNANLADAMRHTFNLTIGTTSLQKTLHEPSAAELAKLAEACNALASYLREHGARRDVAAA